MSQPGPPPDETSPSRYRQVQAVVADVLGRRAGGEALPDGVVIAAHPQLAPDLERELRKRALIEAARRRACTPSDSDDDGSEGVGDALLSTAAGSPRPASRRAAHDAGPIPIASESIPGYSIEAELHRGGQGVVYRALQRSTGRTVAVKVLREGPLAGAVDQARFQQEVRILSQLRHPNIVTVHDSGVIAGCAYFVMAYVPGAPLDKYVEAHRPPAGGGVRARHAETLRLFIKICDAVNTAHLRGVIHRDLKPGNVRVDPAGEPYVLDFGLAKLAPDDPEAVSGSAAMTQSGQFVGSLYWASPEQAQGRSRDIDIRSDVYSLGVMLYQALAGRLPFDPRGTMHEVLERIVSVDAPRPRLDGELDTILLKCLSKPRERRYQSAGDLGRELERYLAGAPIEAKRDSLAYTLQKHLGRHRVAVGIGAAFVLVVTVGFAVSLAAWSRAEKQREQADEQRALAVKRADETRKVAEFQARMLGSVDAEAMGRGIKDGFVQELRGALQRQWVGDAGDRRPRTEAEVATELAQIEERGASVMGADLARRVLDEHVLSRASDAARVQFAEQPLVQARLFGAIAQGYQALGLYAAAEPLFREALALRRTALGEVDPDVASSLNDLGLLLTDKGSYAAAESLHREALTIARSRFGGEHPLVADTLNDLAHVLRHKGEYAAAEPLYREVLALRRALLGDEHLDVAAALNDLACLLRDKGDYTAAESLSREALALRRALLGDEHALVAVTLSTLATLLADKGDDAAAEPLYREVLALRRRVLGNEHPNVANDLNNLANLLQRRGDAASAESLHREALALRRKVLGNEHPNVVNSLNNLALLLQDKGDLAAAETLLREGLALRRKLLGDEHPGVAASLNNLATLLTEKGDDAAAEPLYRDALALFRRRMGDEHPAVARALNNLANLLQRRGDYASAESLHREALALRRRALGDDHLDVANSLNNLAALLTKRGEHSAAEPLQREALAIIRRRLGSEHSLVADAQSNLGHMLRYKGDCAAAEPLFREALTLRRRLLADKHPAVVRSRIDLAMCLTSLGQLVEAQSLLQTAHATLAANAAAPPTLRQRVIETFVELYETWSVAEPDKGYDAQAAEWRAKLTQWQANTQPAASRPGQD